MVRGLALVAIAICLGADKLRRFVEQRKAMLAELNQAKKLEAIGRLAGGVAHDMNHTLNAIIGSVFAHRHEISGNGRSYKDLDNIMSACERGAQLTQNLLGFARKSHHKRQTRALLSHFPSRRSPLPSQRFAPPAYPPMQRNYLITSAAAKCCLSTTNLWYLRAGERMLKTMGCEVLSAASGREGLEKFKSCEGGIHLAIVDLVMPGMDGIATIEEILGIDEATPVLLASGYARESDEIEALKERHPSVGFLAKPYKPEQLIAAARGFSKRQKQDCG